MRVDEMNEIGLNKSSAM